MKTTSESFKDENYADDHLIMKAAKLSSSKIVLYSSCESVSLSTVVLNSRDRQGMYGMQHFCAPINKPHNSL